MRTGISVIAGLIIGAAAWGAAAQQPQPSIPGPGTGIVTVSGDVRLANGTVVGAAQQGEWKVAIANTAPVSVTNTPTVALAMPFSVRKGARYEIVWSAGERETVTISDAGASSWVLVEVSGQPTGRRWINLAQVRSISEAR